MRKARQKPKGKRQKAKVLRSIECAPSCNSANWSSSFLSRFFSKLTPSSQFSTPSRLVTLPTSCLSAAAPPLEELKSEARALVDARRTFTQQTVDEITAQEVLEIYREIAK